MSHTPDFDESAAHSHFSAHCFNQTWGLLEKTDRTADDNEQMLGMCHASLWHWTQRADCTPRNLSIGYWQLARVYALLSQAENARRYAGLCLQYSAEEGPFYHGYAYEALARAEKVAGNLSLFQRYRLAAVSLVPDIEDPKEQSMLARDLAQL